MLIFTSESPSIQGLVQKALRDVFDMPSEVRPTNVVSFAAARARLRPASAPEPNVADRLMAQIANMDAVRYRDSHEDCDGRPPDCA